MLISHMGQGCPNANCVQSSFRNDDKIRIIRAVRIIRAASFIYVARLLT
jgi:hypothetical protein